MMDLSNRITLLQNAEDAAQRGEYDEALGILSRCLDLYPGFSPAGVLRGELLAKVGKSQKSIDELQGIIRSNPENIRARILLTHVLLDEGKGAEAAEHLEFLGFMMPENDPALEELRSKLEASGPQGDLHAEKPVESDWAGEAATIDADEADTISTSVDMDTEVLEIEDLKRIAAKQDKAGEAIESPAEETKTDATEETDAFGEGDGPDEPETPGEMVPDEEVNPADVVTAFVGEETEAATEAEPERRLEETEAVDIKTRTMATVYERQGMFREALEILLSLQEHSDDPTIASDIERIRSTMEGHEVVGMSPDQRRRIIAVLENWVEKVGCNSMN